MTDHQILVSILNADPDGKPKQPTDAARAAFRADVIARHGEAMWDRYLGAWDYA